MGTRYTVPNYTNPLALNSITCPAVAVSQFGTNIPNDPYRPQQHLTIDQLITSVTVQNPKLRCLYYRIPENIFATDFAFADQKNWIKPDYQHWRRTSIYAEPGPSLLCQHHQSGRPVSWWCTSDTLKDFAVNRFDNFIGSENIRNIYLKHGNEYIGPRFNTGVSVPARRT